MLMHDGDLCNYIAYVNHDRTCSWNQPVLSSEGQRMSLMGLTLSTDRLRVRRIHTAPRHPTYFNIQC